MQPWASHHAASCARTASTTLGILACWSTTSSIAIRTPTEASTSDAARAVDFLHTRPEVDRARIGVHGSSQGGALTITTAALRPDAILCGAAGAPYLCGFMDAAALTHSYPYEEINEYLRRYPDREPMVRETLNYFDGINFAPRIRCPMLVNLGSARRRLPAGDWLRVVRRDDLPQSAAHVRRLRTRRRILLGNATHRGVSGRASQTSVRGGRRMSTAFDAFWDAVDDDLARYPMRAELEPLPQRSTESSTTYAVRLTSVGPYRISGFYSVPNNDVPRPVPGLLITPRYGSVNNVPDYYDRERYAVLQLIHRGQRLADRPFAAAYPGLLTLGIDSPETYIYRGIVADCLRGAEFLRSRPELDGGRVGIQGDDLALLTAARAAGVHGGPGE